MAERLIVRVHALQRMFQRGIGTAEVQQALARGKTIERYPDDQPYPSRLVLGWVGARPLHVIVAEPPGQQERIVITVYEPDPGRWEPGFERRRQA
jgi:hypothetical protein